MFDYKQLVIWQKSLNLSVLIYNFTEDFPKNELFGLTSQIRKASVSIPSNIAEGRSRESKKEFLHFLRIAYGSASELQTQIEIAKQLPFSKKLDYNDVEKKVEEILIMLRSMILKFKY